MGTIISFPKRQLWENEMGENAVQQATQEIRALLNSDTEGLELASQASSRIFKAMGLKPDIPIPIVLIADKLGFRVYQQDIPGDDLSGYIAISGDLREQFSTDKVIVVSDKESLGHKRFTIAHELGHYIYDFDPKSEVEYFNTYRTDEQHTKDIKEERANLFAACLLMPKDEFTAEYNVQSGANLYDICNHLADIFQVSSTAVRRRINELGLLTAEK